MSEKWIKAALLLFFAGSLPYLCKAQGADDVLRYSLQYPSYDPISIVVPGVSQPTGFGAYQENPASMAMFDESYFSFGLSNRTVSESGTYLGTSTEFDDMQTTTGNLGFLYKVPTIRGSLVVGAGYSQTTDFNRALAAGGRNEQSTLTDFYNITPDDSLFFAAFDVYAIDYAGTDSSYSNTASIFRVGLDEYPGINQNIELTEQGVMGEYSAFIATELQKGLMIGFSIGLLTGNYTYERTFLETDSQNDYNFQFIDSDSDGQGDTDIDNILSEDVINADFTAFSARLGFVYQVLSFINIGGSYQPKTTLSVEENFNTSITTTFDNGVDFFDDAPGRFSYKITRPDRLNLGITLHDLGGLSLSASAERVRYSEGEIDFADIQMTDAENDINETIESSLADVINLRAGIEYEASELFTPRAGYSYFPSPKEGFDAGRQFFSGGFSAQLFDNISFDLGVQYSLWEDQNQLYRYDTGDGIAGEIVNEEVTRWHVMAGIEVGL